MNKKEIKHFIKTHRDKEYSAAKLVYSMHLYGDLGDKVLKISGKIHKRPEDPIMEEAIQNAGTSEELLNLMRKPMSFSNQLLLRTRILEKEDAMLPLVQRMALRTKHDVFVENAVYVFLKCEANPSSWIMEHYAQIPYEYMKSMLCLVLGFKGTAECIPFLIEEAKRMEQSYPQETYDQGPTLAVQELAVRFLNNSGSSGETV